MILGPISHGLCLISYKSIVNTLYNVCSVHHGMFSSSAGVQYIKGYHEYIGGYHEYIGGYHEYIGGIQYIRGIS